MVHGLAVEEYGLINSQQAIYMHTNKQLVDAYKCTLISSVEWAIRIFLLEHDEWYLTSHCYLY